MAATLWVSMAEDTPWERENVSEHNSYTDARKHLDTAAQRHGYTIKENGDVSAENLGVVGHWRITNGH